MPARETQHFVEVLQQNSGTRAIETQEFVEVLQRNSQTKGVATQLFTEILQRNRYTRSISTQYFVEFLHPVTVRAMHIRLSGTVFRGKLNARVVPFRSIYLLPKGAMDTCQFIEALSRNSSVGVKSTQVFVEVLVANVH